MKITFGDYEVRSNTNCFAIGKPLTRTKSNGKTEEVPDKPSYFPTLESLLKCVPDKTNLENTKATNITELLQELKDYQEMVEKVVRKLDLNARYAKRGDG